MSEVGEGPHIDFEKIKDFAANASRVGGALESLKKHDGWQIFLALYFRRRKEIEGRRNFKDLAEANAGGLALDILEDLFDEMDGFIQDADAAAKALVGISPDDSTVSRGIMLIEAMEGSNRESA